MSPPGRAGRAIAKAAKAVAIGVVVVIAAAGGLVVSTRLPSVRRFVTRTVNRDLAGAFQGTLQVERVGWIGLGSIGGVDARAFDPEGHLVLDVHGARARVDPLATLRSLAGRHGLVVRIPELDVDGAEVVVEKDAEGELGLAHTFEPRSPRTSTEPSTIRVDIGAIHLGHAWVHGHLPAAPVIDADLDDLSGSFSRSPRALDLDVDHVVVHARGMPGMSPDGTLSARARLPAPGGGERRVEARYEGRVGDVPVRAEASLEDDEVAAEADVVEARPAAIAALSRGKIHPGAPVSVRAEAHGRLPILALELHARIGSGTVNALGTVTLPEGPAGVFAADAEVHLHDLDASAIERGAPRSKVSGVVGASVTAPPHGALAGRFDVETQAGEVGGQAVPAVRAHGSFTGRKVSGTATASGRVGHGRAHVVVEGEVDLGTKRIAARARGEVSGIDVKGVQLARGSLTAEANGAIAAPRLDVTLRGAGLRAGGYAFTGVGVHARGTPRDLDVAADLTGDQRSPSASARTHLAYDEALVLRDTSMVLRRAGVWSTVQVASVRAAHGTVDVEGARVAGLGAPVDASARISGSRVSVKAKGNDVDLARLATLLGREEDARGHVALDVDAVATRRSAEGRVDLRARDLTLRGVEGASGTISAVVRGRQVRGEVHASLGDAGRVDLVAPFIELGGAPTEASAWKRAIGDVAVDGAVDLSRLLAKLPAEARPALAARGTVTIHGRVARLSPDATPALDLRASTRDLAVVAKGWHTEGLDGTAAVNVAGGTGQTRLSAQLHDARGASADVEASATLPLARLVEEPRRLGALAMDMPVEARIEVPRWPLDDMPPPLGTLPVQGDVALDARIAGTARAPHIAIAARGTNLTARDAATCARPVDLGLSVTYDGEIADVRVAAASEEREVMKGSATVRASAARAIAGGPLAWEASAKVGFARFPLDAVGAVVGQAVTGELSGDVEVADLHRAASLAADLDLRDVKLDRTELPHGEIRVAMKEGSFAASGRLDQLDGSLVAQANGAVSWGDALAPSLELSRPIDASIRAENFRVNAAAPFVRSALGEIDGRMDTNARIHVEPGGKDGSVDGSIAIRDGVLDVPQIGRRLHAVSARIVMRPWGTLRFEDVSASAPTGRLQASAEAVLHGLSIQRVDARVHVAKGESVPVTVEGVPMGRAYGDVKASVFASPDERRLDVQVDVPALHVDLPQAIGHKVQRLEEDPTIRVGVVSDRGFTPLPLAPPSKSRAPSDVALHVAVKLGDDVVLRREGSVDVTVSGETFVDVTDRTRVRGQIRVVSGTIQLQGKQFVIDHGTVSFVGPDPSDPTVVAAAYWDGPEGTRVFADFNGTASAGKLTLRAEPALSQDQILALILFGSPDGLFGAQAPGAQEWAGAKAAGLAGDVLAQSVNKAISGITSADITTRVDTSEAGNPRPELDVQLSRTITARLGYKLGVPGPGENPDRTQLTIDWRFIRDWSLTAEVGDAGSTSLDVVWRMRY